MCDVLRLHFAVPFSPDEYNTAVERLEQFLILAERRIDVICTMAIGADNRSTSASAFRYDKMLGAISPYIGTIALVSPLTANICALARTMFVSALSITGMCERIHVMASIEEARQLIAFHRQGAP